MQNYIREKIDRHPRMLRGQIDIINSPIKSRVGIDVAAMGLHRRRNLTARPARGSLEEHVFQIVGQAGPERPTLVDTTRFDPDLHRTNRGRAIALEQHRQPVRQSESINGFTPQTFE